MPYISELIQELRLRLKESGEVLASTDDADYFRTTFKKSIPFPPSIQSPPTLEQVPIPRHPSAIEKSSDAPNIQEDASPIAESVHLNKAAGKPSAQQPMTPDKPGRDDAAKQQDLPPVAKPAALSKSVPKPGALPPIDRSIDRGMMTLVKAVMPQLAILEEIPDDSSAKKIAARWKTKNQCAPICVLSSTELPQYQTFLQDLAGALDVHFGPAKIVDADKIEQERQWESFLSTEGLKLLIICDTALWQLQHLRQFYKETPAQGSRTIGKVPLFLLPDLSLYFKDPLLKKSLWKALCQKCS